MDRLAFGVFLTTPKLFRASPNFLKQVKLFREIDVTRMKRQATAESAITKNNFDGPYFLVLQTRAALSAASLVKAHTPHHLPLVVLSEQLIVRPLYRGWRDNKALRAVPLK